MKKEKLKQNDINHEAILDNFDAFVKMAGTELIQLKDVAKNISGIKSIDCFQSVLESRNIFHRLWLPLNKAWLLEPFNKFLFWLRLHLKAPGHWLPAPMNRF